MLLLDTDFQKIFNELEVLLPRDWEKLVAYFEYGEASYLFYFYVLQGGKYIKCYDLLNASEDSIADIFREIDKILFKAQKNQGWSNLTMVVDKEGNMHSDFDYSDLSEGAYEYHKEWKKKYLG